MKTLTQEAGQLSGFATSKIEVLRERLLALRGRQSEARRRETELFGELREARGTSPVHDLERLLLLDATASPVQAVGAHEKVRDVQILLEGVSRAIKATELEILQLQAEEDAKACRDALPAHRRNVRMTINAVLSLHRSVVAQDQLRLDLALKGVERTSQLVPLFPRQFLDGMADPNSFISLFMRNAVDAGFITEWERVKVLKGELDELDI